MQRRPRHRRFDGIELEICWAAIETLPIELQHELLRELASDVAAARGRAQNPAGNVAAAVVCLRDAADILGHSPSLLEYRRLRDQLPELGLIPDGTIRRRLGPEWNRCLARALLDAVSDGDFVAPPQGDAFSEEELVSAIREYQGDHDGRVPSLQQLLMWARDPEVQARPGRRPLSWSPFQRFGGYRTILEKTGLGDGDVLRRDVVGRVVPLSYAYGDEELRAAPREVASRLGRTPTASEYTRERQRILEEARAAGSPRSLPTVSTLTKRFGPWPNVLTEAGLPSALGTSTRQKRERTLPRYAADEKVEWLRRAWIELGQPFTEKRYGAWRRAKLDQASERGEYLAVPSVGAIYTGFGSWGAGCRAALPSGAKTWQRRG